MKALKIYEHNAFKRGENSHKKLKIGEYEETKNRQKYIIMMGKYEGKVVDGEQTMPHNIKTIYGNYFFEPDTIRKIDETISFKRGENQYKKLGLGLEIGNMFKMIVNIVWSWDEDDWVITPIDSGRGIAKYERFTIKEMRQDDLIVVFPENESGVIINGMEQDFDIDWFVDHINKWFVRIDENS